MTPNFKCGFVAIVGRPNAGKSSLLNALVGDKISIVSPIPQTTRHQIRGILNLKEAQVVFVDTPGVHSFSDSLAQHLNTVAANSLEGCDLVIYVADTSRYPGPEDKSAAKLLKGAPKVIIVLNKIDLGKKCMNEHITFWQEEAKSLNKEDFFFTAVSAKEGKNILELRDLIIKELPEGPAFYEPHVTTDFPVQYRIADVIREKLFTRVKRELPHSIAVEIEQMEEGVTTQGYKITRIKSIVYVNRVSQKQIIIGKNGNLLKEVGTEARIDLEKILGQKVFLEIFVKVMEDWQKKSRILQELGYWWM
jgi:GTP-binding protein Era